jgi:hypothetical protein
MKRFFYILVVLIAAALIIFLGYFLRSRTQESGVVDSGGGLPNGQILPSLPGGNAGGGIGMLPTSTGGGLLPNQRFGLVSDQPASDFFVDKDNSVIVIQKDGVISKISGSTSAQISSSQVQNLANSSFSYDGGFALVSYGNRPNLQYSVFDIVKKTWSPLTLNIQSANWYPNVNRILVVRELSGKKDIGSLDPLKPATTQSLIRLEAKDVVAEWINNNLIFLSDKSSAAYAGSAWMYDISKSSIVNIFKDRFGASVLWDNLKTPRGLYFLSGRNGRGGELNLIDDKGNIIRRMSFVTFPSKCVFWSESVEIATSAGSTTTKPSPTNATTTKDYLICAAPRDSVILGRSFLPDDYLKKSLYTNDDFYKIDLSDGTAQTLFADQTLNLDAQKLKIVNGKLFFINRYDDKIYAVSLSNLE